jgi:hypothetical protein
MIMEAIAASRAWDFLLGAPPALTRTIHKCNRLIGESAAVLDRWREVYNFKAD